MTVAVTDKDGDTGSATAAQFVVIYDPAGGFVTGGGWIDSPAGAYTADPSMTGKANFGFVSKYKKGASIPTGQTQFQFKAGDLNFQSSSYDCWSLRVPALSTRASGRSMGQATTASCSLPSTALCPAVAGARATSSD